MRDEAVLQSIVLGIIQGLTEFLPISSSAHLILLPWLLGWAPLGLSFDVVIHIGTLLAVLGYFRREWAQTIQEAIHSLRGGKRGKSSLLWPLVVGTLPAIAAGGLGKDLIEQHLRSPTVTVVTLSLFGVFLWVADRRGARSRSLGELTLRDGLLIGCAQALALVPGVSRSGVTITAALFLGLGRADSARFSFLLAGPIIALAGASAILDLWSTGGGGLPVLPLLLGVSFSLLSGFLCIQFFLRFLQTRTFLPFAVYRLVLALFILILLVL